MAKLYFRHGAMGSSKTANALMVRYNYLEKGQKVALLKPAGEDRDGARQIRSRIGLEAECLLVDEFLKKPDLNLAAIIVDEAQFLTSEQVDQLSDLVDDHNIPVICYGLRSDFQGKLFPGSRRLLEIADEIEEIPTVCWCGRKAHFNARIREGRIVREGEQVLLGSNDVYVSLCRHHFKSGELGLQ